MVTGCVRVSKTDQRPEPQRYALREAFARNSRHGFQTDNMYQVIRLITRCALAREESRGGHYRVDFPSARTEFRKHSRIRRGAQVRFVEVGAG